MWIVIAMALVVLSIALHAAVVRLLPTLNRPASFLMVGSFVGAAGLVWAADRYGVASTPLAGFAMAYAFGCELYLFLFSSALTSISMNLLVRLLDRPMSDAEIAELYESRRMVERRIERLQATGLMRPASAGGYIVTPGGMRLLRGFNALAQFFGNTPAARKR